MSKRYKDREWLSEQIKAGRTLTSIARECGVNPSTIFRWTRKLGIIKPSENPLISYEELKRLYLDLELSFSQIANLLTYKWERKEPIKPSYVKWLTEKYGLIGKKKLNIEHDIVEYVDRKERSIEEVWKATIEHQKRRKEYEIVQKEATINISTQEAWILLVFMSDLHVGSRFTDYEALYKHVNLISETPNVYVFLLGDLHDNFVIPTMNRTWDSIITPKEQKYMCKDIATKLKGKVLVSLIGDHEMFSEYMANYNIVDDIVDILNCVFLGFGGLVYLRVNDIEYKIGIRHRYRYNSSLNLTHTVKRMLEREFDADIGVIAHGHVADIEQAPLRGRYRVFIRSGTYKPEDRYLQLKGFDGVVGTKVPCVLLSSKSKKAITFLDLETAIETLKALNLYYKIGD